jgi:hypothetical protein
MSGFLFGNALETSNSTLRKALQQHPNIQQKIFDLS